MTDSIMHVQVITCFCDRDQSVSAGRGYDGFQTLSNRPWLLKRNLSLSLLDIRCTLHKPYLKAYKPPKSLDAKESSARPEFKSP